MRNLFLLILLLPACSKEPLTATYLVAHRGASAIAPENTLASFQLAWDGGASNIEGDFYLAADGRIVCIHDRDTKRTAGTQVSVAETASDDLRKLEVGSWKGPQWTDEKIPFLEEVLAGIPDNGRLLLEIKCGIEILPTLAYELSKADLRPEQVNLICFNKEVVALAEKILPEYESWWLLSFKEKDGAWLPPVEEVFSTLKEIGAEGLGCNAKLEVVSEEFVKELHSRGFKLNVWTVNDAKVAKELRSRGVDLITTDRPLQLTNELAQP